ncbi:DUF3885 domain-containing protein [Brevundimonas sp.]|uniref:DUF3885 domain-containing protein n=1 Tax=Brevundimonas sp. TaxID=1871086 RepID=UPI0037C15E1A
MFYEADYSLRFDLGGEIGMGPLRFMQALDRARAISKVLFSTSETLHAVVTMYGEQRNTSRHYYAFQKLRGIGFDHSFGVAEKIAQNDQEYIGEFGSDLFRYWYAAPFKNDNASVSALLWASVSREMDIHPSPRWIDTIHIVDFRNRLALTAYDDRGMDVVGPDGPALASLYNQFSAWLLDYDRPTMDAKFSGLPGQR